MKSKMKMLWEMIITWIKEYVYSGEPVIDEFESTVINQYSVVKYNYERLFDNNENEDQFIQRVLLLMKCANETRLNALQACIEAVTTKERCYMNGILSEMTSVQDELEMILSKIDDKSIKHQLIFEQDRTLNYIVSRDRNNHHVKHVMFI